jgi:hypothetical protein
MSRGVQAFRLTEVKRAARALRQAGVKIARVTIEGGKVEFITADAEPQKTETTETTAERWLREQKRALPHENRS